MLAMIDLDASLYVEYDDGTKEPLALIEAARDVGQTFKTATVTKKLAARCVPVLPAFCLLYKTGSTPNPADNQWRDIIQFRYKQIHPVLDLNWITVTPLAWAEKLLSLRVLSAMELDSAYAAG